MQCLERVTRLDAEFVRQELADIAGLGQGLGLPPANGQYALIDVQLKVTGKELLVNPLYVRYQAADGKTFTVAAGNGFASGHDPQLQTGTIPEGQSTRGLVVIDVPEGAGKQVQLTDELGTVIGVWEM